MTTLKIHNIETAPEGSKALLEQSQKQNGMIPGLHGVLAGAPEILEAYQTLHRLFTQSSFNKEELTVVWQTINVEHECHYCVPAHTAIAGMMKVDSSLSEALRNRTANAKRKIANPTRFYFKGCTQSWSRNTRRFKYFLRSRLRRKTSFGNHFRFISKSDK